MGQKMKCYLKKFNFSRNCSIFKNEETSNFFYGLKLSLDERKLRKKNFA